MKYFKGGANYKSSGTSALVAVQEVLCSTHSTRYFSFLADKNVNSTGVCSHGRAWAIFLESLTSKHCQFLGFSCPGLRDFRQDFLHGNCFRSCKEGAPTCGVMGQVGTARGSLYLVTRSTGPYCGG
jgi:hypothetical protein